MCARGNLPQLTSDLVFKLAKEFDKHPIYGPVDRSLRLLFESFPLNRAVEEVILKATGVDRLYGTNVFAVVELGTGIWEADIDPRLEQCDLSLVDEIAMLPAGGKPRRRISFASKYCSWHRPAAFPIFDAVVKAVLRAYDSGIRERDLCTYAQFCEALARFKERLGLSHLHAKTVDKALWLLGKQHGLS